MTPIHHVTSVAFQHQGRHLEVRVVLDEGRTAHARVYDGGNEIAVRYPDGYVARLSISADLDTRIDATLAQGLNLIEEMVRSMQDDVKRLTIV